ncbi:MAG: hypothetical protein ACD_49C00077G0003 [uncultured bacterium (gcode 4)]|uniref:Uncharacterized protein n=1 Tax=uncultured bacterium (gcode 4) TaxID=1234023 RepID=K2ACY0_9BACT|nr:MAG: hypothetical protein ACD_49C00077G0003 [uncultured bacterium (gcode 4)]
MWLTFDFIYDFTRLNKFSFDIFSANFDLILLIILVISLVVYVALYFVAPYIYWFLLVRNDQNRTLRNKDKIKELILMKEIQQEFENEMEQAFLNAGLKKEA